MERDGDDAGMRALAGGVRVRDFGSVRRVTVEAWAVSSWARRWPCFGDVRGVWAEFCLRTGDVRGTSDVSGMDGAGVSALLADVRALAWEVAGTSPVRRDLRAEVCDCDRVGRPDSRCPHWTVTRVRT